MWSAACACGSAESDTVCPVWNVDMRALKIAGAVIGVVVVVIALLLVIGIPSGFLTAQIQERVERETGYKLAINGGARIGLWPSLNITLNDITLQHPKDRDINRHFAARRDGTARDTVMYSILAAEWPDVRRHLDLRLARHAAASEA